MKGRFAFRMAIGIGIGTATGMAYHNLPAGISFDVAGDTLANLLPALKIYQRDNKKN